MKKYFISLILIFTCLTTVAQDYKGTPIEGVTTIERVIDNSQNKSIDLEKEIADQTTPAARIVGTPTGNSAEVGITEGQLSVSLSGAANYSIPIAVPPGINGVVPQISLAYSSQAGNGMAGYGWNISGISAITRIPSTKFHDGVIDPVDFDALDRFALDGQRLLLKDSSQTYGAPGTIYETENFSNIKITADGGTNNNPASFTVEYPDGSKSRYGLYTSKSITTWAINSWTNAQNVTIAYGYVNINNNLVLTDIFYGGLFEELLPIGIEFIYTDRARPEQSYVGGQSVILNKILTEIKVRDFRNYYLTYDETSLGYNRLKKITEKSVDNTKEYNPTVFSYDTTNDNDFFNLQPTVQTNLSGISGTSTKSFSGDFDGDGKNDIVLYPITGINANDRFHLFKDIISGTNATATTLYTGLFQNIFASNITDSNNKLYPKQSITTIATNSNSTLSFKTYTYGTFGFGLDYTKNIPISVRKRNGCEYTYNGMITCTQAYSNVPVDINSLKSFAGDFNGDGITDAILINNVSLNEVWCSSCYTGHQPCNQPSGCYNATSPTTNLYYASFVDLKRDATISFVDLGWLYSSIQSNTKIEVVDYDGDGKSELLIINNGQARVMSLNSSNQFVNIADIYETGINPNYALEKIV